ncbi:MAG TPA: hypothetical protein VG935_01410, partial [Patescibacteria group bacterium]|nr:hypothetical protein [Patescibacteria group bacterium]
AGYPDDALAVWQKTSGTGYHHKAEVLSMIAISQARNGIDPRQAVASAVDLAEALKSDDRYHPSWKQAEIYANLSRAYAPYGLDVKPLIDRAVEKAQTEPTNLRADAYTAIAKAQVSFGADARPMIALAQESADDIVKPGEEADSGYGGPIQILNWEEIFHTQLDGKYYDDARDTLARMDRYSDQDILGEKAELLAHLAREQSLQAAK